MREKVEKLCFGDGKAYTWKTKGTEAVAAIIRLGSKTYHQGGV